MKKLFIAGIALALVVAGGVYATTAYFSDTETSTNNTFTAGSIDLQLGSAFSSLNNGSGTVALASNNNDRALFNFDDLKPGDMGQADFQLKVTSNDAFACALPSLTFANENGLTDPEAGAGDTTTNASSPAVGGGELQNYLEFVFWNDLNSNQAYDSGTEGALYGPYAFSDIDGNYIALADASGSPILGSMLAGNTQADLGMMYCFGTINTGTMTCDGSGNQDDAQTDQVEATLQFYSVQARNNSGFECASLGDQPNSSVTTVGSGDILGTFVASNDRPSYFNDNRWFFYNDTNDTIDPSIGSFVAGPGTPAQGTGSAEMTLATATDRSNIATYRFRGVKLSDITTLKYGADTSSVSHPTYLHFNVSFDGVDSWQKRLVYVPGTSSNPSVAANTWQTFDTIASGSGMWTWSGWSGSTPWPDGNTSQYRSWSDIMAAFPNAKIRVTDGFFGLRVGHPGPAGLTGHVDFVNFNGHIYDFEN